MKKIVRMEDDYNHNKENYDKGNHNKNEHNKDNQNMKDYIIFFN